MVWVAVLPVHQDDLIEEPGADRSRQLPKLEQDERASVDVVEPSVMAFATRAGERLQAFWLSLPVATTTVTPALMRLLAAVLIADGAGPRRLMFTTVTVGLTWLVRSHSIPEVIVELAAPPVQPNTRTDTNVTDLAMP